MSHYEDYSRTAGHYDATRSAVGSHIWLGHVAARFDDPSALRVLDAGCGTGNYALALAPHVGRVTALDRNPRMLDEARAKAAAGGGGIEFRQGELLDLPLAAESFDVVMFNQVLHHLEPPGATGFPGFRGAIAEAARVLRAGGLVFINACARRQMRRGFSYHALIPGAARKGL
ncbi:MAG: class I SAM-dependent methyltransferase, partial [Paracoccaceae bacterium]